MGLVPSPTILSVDEMGRIAAPIFTSVGEDAVNGSGDVLLMANGREIQWKKPRVYQSRKAGTKTPIEGRYRLNDDGAVGFELGAYDPRHALVIDPVVAFSTYLGGNTNDSATRNAVDPSGNVYVTGRTLNVGFPVTPGFPVTNVNSLSTAPFLLHCKKFGDSTGLPFSYARKNAKSKQNRG